MNISDIEVNIESQLNAIGYYIQMGLDPIKHNNVEELVSIFTAQYKALLQKHEHEDLTDLAKFYRLITEFKPALTSILELGVEFDKICDLAVDTFNIVLNRIRGQVNEGKISRTKPKGPIMPGSAKSINLKYFCKVCKEEFEIPPEMQTKLLNSEDKMDLPHHCETEMVVKIAKLEPQIPIQQEPPAKKIDIYPAELLMSHSNSENSNVEYLKILSVGIDIGSSTSHLIFSRLTLRRESSFFNMSNRFHLVDREIVYEGNIIFTPLIDRFTIDIEAIIKFCEDEYKKAGITPEMVDTGAVIVTGETAKKQNAAEIAQRLSSETGKFVSATAGPNFESLLGAMGSGIVKRTKEKQNTIMNVDVGGGTSNIAIASKGEVLSCSCINVGGRLLGIDENFKIWRIDEPSEVIMNELGMNYRLEDIISEKDAIAIARAYAEALLEVMRGPATSKIAKSLMMTEDIQFSTPIDHYSFSGGVAEILYGEGHPTNAFKDIGHYLALEIKSLFEKYGMSIIQPENKIRATVIGAGSFSLSVSGSTCYVDKSVNLPLNNIPVIPVNISEKNFTPDIIIEEITQAYKKYDMIEGEDRVALYFKQAINLYVRREELLTIFAKAIEKALPSSVSTQKPIILLFEGDMAKLLGITIHRETTIKTNLICLDELTLEAGDWIDIGAPLQKSNAYPVTIKSLVFNQHKKDI